MRDYNFSVINHPVTSAGMRAGGRNYTVETPVRYAADTQGLNHGKVQLSGGEIFVVRVKKKFDNPHDALSQPPDFKSQAKLQWNRARTANNAEP